MAKRSSRTLKMMGEFMALHNAGHSIPEIAKMNGVDFSVVYRKLGEIAEKNGVTRESLLEAPHPNYSRKGGSKMAVYRLKGKTMHEQVKHGFTKADFCAKYQCTEEELIAQIRKILCDNPQAVNEILNDITANEKRAARAKPKATKQTMVPKAEPASDTQPVEPEVTPVPESATPLTKEQQLAELNAAREDLFRQSDEANKKYAEADKNYGKTCNQLKELENQLKKLKAELKEVEGSFEEARAKSEQFLKERTDAMSERQEIAHKMARVSLKISDLSAVQLIACDDGTIEAIDEPDFQMDETGAEAYYNFLVHDGRCSELRMKDIRLLSRTIAIHKNSKDRRVDVTFDDERLTDFFIKFVIAL